MTAAVSRETLPALTVRPLLFRKYLRDANAAGVKDTTRRILTAANSQVIPGTFAGLDLDSGRMRRSATVGAELRARCTFESGRVRVVSVLPQVRRGDVFWIKDGRFGSRAKSEQTIVIAKVRVARVQDMTDNAAEREGVAFLPKRLKRHSPHNRDWFGAVWDDINGPGSWAANPWVWVYEYQTYPENVDALLKRWGRT